jgi:Tetratricopeptide repeat
MTIERSIEKAGLTLLRSCTGGEAPATLIAGRGGVAHFPDAANWSAHRRPAGPAPRVAVIGDAAKAAHNPGMRGVLVILFMLGLVSSGTVYADQDDPRLPALFARLKTAESDSEARVVETIIWQIWSVSADDEVNAMMLRGLQAMTDGNPKQALTVFDAMVQRSPYFAEGWNKRATVYYLLGDFDASVGDIEHTLQLEPHHFGAFSGLGQIYLALGRDEAALKAFEAALAIDPHLTGIRAAVESIKKKREGDPT